MNPSPGGGSPAATGFLGWQMTGPGLTSWERAPALGAGSLERHSPRLRPLCPPTQLGTVQGSLLDSLLGAKPFLKERCLLKST